MITHAPNQGISLSKITDGDILSERSRARALRLRTAYALSDLPSAQRHGLRTNDLDTLARAFATLITIGDAARRDREGRETVWIMIAGGAWQDSTHREVAGFRADGFDVVTRITPII